MNKNLVKISQHTSQSHMILYKLPKLVTHHSNPPRKMETNYLVTLPNDSESVSNDKSNNSIEEDDIAKEKVKEPSPKKSKFVT